MPSRPGAWYLPSSNLRHWLILAGKQAIRQYRCSFLAVPAGQGRRVHRGTRPVPTYPCPGSLRIEAMTRRPRRSGRRQPPQGRELAGDLVTDVLVPGLGDLAGFEAFQVGRCSTRGTGRTSWSIASGPGVRMMPRSGRAGETRELRVSAHGKSFAHNILDQAYREILTAQKYHALVR